MFILTRTTNGYELRLGNITRVFLGERSAAIRVVEQMFDMVVSQ